MNKTVGFEASDNFMADAGCEFEYFTKIKYSPLPAMYCEEKIKNMLQMSII